MKADPPRKAQPLPPLVSCTRGEKDGPLPPPDCVPCRALWVRGLTPLPSVLYRHGLSVVFNIVTVCVWCLAEAVEAASDELGILGGLVVVAHLRHVVHAAQDARHALVHVLCVHPKRFKQGCQPGASKWLKTAELKTRTTPASTLPLLHDSCDVLVPWA